MTNTKSIGQLHTMSIPAAVEAVTNCGLGRLLYHESLTVFLPHRGNMWRKESKLIGRWLIEKRDAVQAYLRDVHDGQSFGALGSQVVGESHDEEPDYAPEIEADDADVEAVELSHIDLFDLNAGRSDGFALQMKGIGNEMPRKTVDRLLSNMGREMIELSRM